MWRRLVVSALVGVGFLGLVVAAQPPGNQPPKQPEKKAVDPVEAQIAGALANDPDVRVAQAKVSLAEAELSKARQVVAQKVISLNAAIAELKPAVRAAEEQYTFSERLYKQGTVSQQEMLVIRERLETAKAKLARLETELKLLTGDGPKAATDKWTDDLIAIHKNTKWEASCLACHKTPAGLAARIDQLVMKADPPAAGTIPARVRTALDRKVKLGVNGDKVTFEKALDVFKAEAGLDVPVRVEAKVSPIFSLGEELPVGAWLQLFADGTPGTVILVREYGLLVTNKSLSPPDGVSLFDFWKLTPTPAHPPQKTGSDPAK
jgi:hypothetical protein